MLKNYKLLLGLYTLSVVIMFLGCLFKILHWNGANTWLICGFIPQAILTGYVVYLIFNDQTIRKYKILWILCVIIGSTITAFIYLLYKIKQKRSSVNELDSIISTIQTSKIQ
jgi:fructose-specific phosphotransferase system IIC component